MSAELGLVGIIATCAAESGRALRSVVGHATVQAWLWDVWSRLRMAMEADAARPDGRTLAVLDGMLANLGEFLQTDETARARLQAAAAAGSLATRLGMVAGWDTPTLVDRLELRVGRDLQYVRVNGTVVGFLVGGVVYLVLRLTFGSVSL